MSKINTSIGMLPISWEIRSLEEVADVIDPHPSHRAPKAIENGYPFLGIGDLDAFGNATFDSARKVGVNVMEDHENSYIIDECSIGYAKMGNTIGKVVSFPKRTAEQRFAISPALSIINPKSNINPYFLRAVVESKQFFAQVNGRITGSTRPSIGIQLLRKILIPFPSQIEQDIIGGVWKNLYDKISLNNKINRNLEEQAFVLFDSYFPNAIYGERKIGDFISPSRGKNLVTKDAIPGDVPVVAGGLSPSTYHNESNTTGPVLTISASGANAGYVRLWNQSVWSSDSSYIDSSMTDNVYFWYVMLKKRQKEIFDSQTGSAQPHVYPKNIEMMPVINLDKAAITEYTNEVTPMFYMIGSNNKENISLSELRDSLLPKLISGEMDVSDLDI